MSPTRAGKWVPAVAIIVSTPTRTTLTTDGFGRALFFAKAGDAVRGSGVALGFKSQEFDWKCSNTEPRHEQFVRLEKG